MKAFFLGIVERFRRAQRYLDDRTTPQLVCTSERATVFLGVWSRSARLSDVTEVIGATRPVLGVDYVAVGLVVADKVALWASEDDKGFEAFIAGLLNYGLLETLDDIRDLQNSEPFVKRQVVLWRRPPAD